MSRDQDRGKGALEQDDRTQPSNTSLAGQLGHRTSDPMLKASDTDFPEPGENPAHSGQRTAKRGPGRPKRVRAKR